jgi:hypothetical protein
VIAAVVDLLGGALATLRLRHTIGAQPPALDIRSRRDPRCSHARHAHGQQFDCTGAATSTLRW